MYQDILVPIDMSDEQAWQKPLSQAVALAQKLGARLHIMTVLPTFNAMVETFFPADFEQKARDKTNQDLHAFVQKQIPSDISVQTIVAVGTIYEEIISTAHQVDCDLIIMGRSGEHHSRFLFGPNAERVVRHSDRSVLVVC
jgi:nucleotide-binding universal stress UspA family protein